MSDTISDEFAIANGIAALLLVTELINQIDPTQAKSVMSGALERAKGYQKQKHHPALPIAADLLRDGLQRLLAMSGPSH